MLRPGGRVGVLANLASSGRQAYAVYRAMIEELGLPEFPITAPESVAQITAALERGGAAIEEAWVHSFRLWFASGADLASWLQESGFATHPAIEERPRQLVRMAWQGFAERVEAQREPQGLALDFDAAGVVAAAPARS